MHLHSVHARYVQEHAHEANRRERRTLREALFRRFLKAARDLAEQPANIAAITVLTQFSPVPDIWFDGPEGLVFVTYEALTFGDALMEIGRFTEAHPWHERFVAAGAALAKTRIAGKA
jgi:hypothetical protein